MTDKIKPKKKIHKWEKYNCTGKLRVEIKASNGDIDEVYLMPKKGGCKTLIESLGRMVTFCLECNIDPKYIIDALENTTPCTAPTLRQKRENLPKEEIGFGGCPKIVAQAMREKLGKDG
jgi:hypothetical protein